MSVYDAGELDDGRPYLVMSYADQGTLADRLEIDGLTAAQALEVVRQVGARADGAARRGVLHRDVKPANVLFRTVDTRDGGTPVRAMLADLGLGKALDMSSRLTMIGGTPSFVAPEQAQGEPLDPRADQYSLAALTTCCWRAGRRTPTRRCRLPPTRRRPRRCRRRAGVPGARSRTSCGGGSRPTAPTGSPTSRRTSTPSRTALGDGGAGAPLPAAGCRSTRAHPAGHPADLVPAATTCPAPVAPQPRRRWPAVALAVVLLVAGAVGGYPSGGTCTPT